MARKVESFESMIQPINWKKLTFEYTQSTLRMVSWPSLLPELEPETAQSFLDLIGARYPFSPQYSELQRICPELTFKRDAEEWVFYAGSFNPWHKGHQACLDLLPADRLCFILPDRNPQKQLNPLSTVFRMLELIKSIKFGKNHFIAPTFLMDFQTNPTVNWIRLTRTHLPQKKLSLLMGFDTFKGIPSWIRPEELLPLLDRLYVVSRLEEPEEQEAASAPVKSLAPKLEIIFLGHHEFEPLSSTALRKTT